VQQNANGRGLFLLSQNLAVHCFVIFRGILAFHHFFQFLSISVDG